MAKMKDQDLEGQQNEQEKTPFFCRINKVISKTFTAKVVFSKYKREEIVEKLMTAYNNKGDELIDELENIK